MVEKTGSEETKEPTTKRDMFNFISFWIMYPFLAALASGAMPEVNSNPPENAEFLRVLYYAGWLSGPIGCIACVIIIFLGLLVRLIMFVADTPTLTEMLS